MSVVIETTLGVFTVDLYTKLRPKICMNFLKLCKTKYYNFSLFHNVQNCFMAQTGDPTGTGRGGESIFKSLYGAQAAYFEGDKLPKINHNRKGLISMVSVSQGMFGSQFFITLDEDLQNLDGEHCVFGEISEGEEIVEKFNEVISDEDHRPYKDIRITHTVILDDPFDDPKDLEIPPESPKPDPAVLRSSGRLAADEDVEDDQGMTAEELEEKMAAKEAKAQATILEMVGDLPDADCAPPENVLFVCKLNPVTTDEDLETIFSRFGEVVSCEVIRDHKTGDSLQYAFVEFSDQKACETAYFKMDNVLIDDRRIHVDFSQSVSKFRWKGKGRLEVLDDKGEKKKQPKDDRRSDKPKPRYYPAKRRSRSKSRDRDRREGRRRADSRERRSPESRRRRSSRSPSPRRHRKRSPEAKKRRSRSRSRERRRSSKERRRRSRSKDRRKRSRSRSRERSHRR